MRDTSVENKTEKHLKHINIGLLAHVDAGKTTLSEGLLYLGGSIRHLGRVDHGDAFLDTFALEKERGITIFSKQAQLETDKAEFTLLDTPGHVDFSAEMERTLQVLDYAVLVVSGMDGVQSHTLTLWKLLERYEIPVFLFINKMDQPGTDRSVLLADLKKRLSDNCVDFGDVPESAWMENLAMCEEELLEEYLETGAVKQAEIVRLIAERKAFPCFFGSALKMQGVREFLTALEDYTRQPVYPSKFGARVYKITRDAAGVRLTYLKVTGGSLKVKTLLSNHGRPGRILPGQTGREEEWEEKIDQIRIYSGAKFQTAAEAPAGTVCAVSGLAHTYPGEGLGIEPEAKLPVLEPVLNYRILLPEGCDIHRMLANLKQLEEEDPQLHILWDPRLEDIHVQMMGEVQTEVLKSLIWERFHVAAEFDAGNIVYKETIAAPVEGVGHFEPLRHYAEVHLLIEPGEPGSGCQYFTACSEDVLARNWQRLILTHLEEKEHVGVLTGSALTDVQITLLTGRAHPKHTEGGDFRQATYRAVRQGLKKAESILLEPWYEFRLELPAEFVGRAMADVRKMQGKFSPPETDGENAVLSGTAAVARMRDYQKQVTAYTGGRGRLFCSLKGYAPCLDQDSIVAQTGYDSEHDTENPTGSVFCAHGAGFVVPWDEVENYMHLHSGINVETPDGGSAKALPSGGGKNTKDESYSYSGSYAQEKELQEIFERTFGPVKRPGIGSALGQRRGTGLAGGNKSGGTDSEKNPAETASVHAVHARAGKQEKDEYLLVDGYNVIFSWDELRELAKDDIHAACEKLKDILSNYQGYAKCTLILVFDAYKVEGHSEEIVPYHNIHVVYTREAETADQYIEKTVHKIGRKHSVTVATSDGLEQVIILGQGARRVSAQGLKKEIEETERLALTEWRERRVSSRSYLFDSASPELLKEMERIRLGKNTQD